MPSCRAGCIWFSTRFLNFFLSEHELTCSMKHVCRSDLPLRREDASPYFMRKVDGGFRKSIASATDSVGNYSPK